MGKTAKSSDEQIKKTRRRDLMQFSESQLVLASLNSSTQTTTTMRDSEPSFVTPSPNRQSDEQQKSKSETKPSPRKQLFATVTKTKQQIVQEENGENQRVSVKKRLFVNNNSKSAPCSSAPRIPDEWLMQQTESRAPLPPPDLPTQIIAGSSINALVKNSRFGSAPIDSLGSLSSSMATTVTLKAKQSAKLKTIKRRKRIKKIKKVKAPKMKKSEVGKSSKVRETRPPKDESEIPTEIAAVLNPLGKSRKPRTGAQILGDKTRKSQTENSNGDNMKTSQRTVQNSIIKVRSESPKRKKSKSSKKKRTKESRSKVRFAPLPTATTTFTIKIRVKTRNTNNNGITQPPLNEATMQRIANQITQACLAQSGNSNMLAGIGNGAFSPTHNLLENGTDSTRNTLANGAIQQGQLELDFDCDASVLSDLTREKDMQRDLAGNEQPHQSQETEDNVFEFDTEGDDLEDLDPPSIRRGHTSLASRAFAKKPALKRSVEEDSASVSSKRRLNLFKSSDSLASMSLAGRADPPRVKKSNAATSKVPMEVSVDKRSPTKDSSRDQTKFLGRRLSNLSKNALEPKSLRLEVDEEAQDQLQEIDDTIVTDQSANSHLRSSLIRRKEAKAVRDDDEFSYLSEVEWGVKKAKPVKKLSRAARLWNSIGKHKNSVRQGRSNSSVTSLTGEDAPIPLNDLSRKRGVQSKRKGSKKDPLHDMEMSLPTDGSVASWVEGRRNLRALMQYDEADQDWV